LIRNNNPNPDKPARGGQAGAVEEAYAANNKHPSLGHKKLSGDLRKALPRLKKTGLLEYTIPEKPKSRLQKYRLTPKGKAVIDAQRTERLGPGHAK